MERRHFLVGQRISLSNLSEEDLSDDAPYFQWMNDLGLDTFTERGRFPNHPARHRSYFDRSADRGSIVLLGIFDNTTGRHIGNVSYKDINWHSRRGFLGYVVGEADFVGKGIATEAVGMFLLYGFQKLNFHRVHTTVALDNVASIKVLERNGLIREGVMPQHIISGDRKLDVAAYGTLAENWMPAHADRVRKSFQSAPF